MLLKVPRIAESPNYPTGGGSSSGIEAERADATPVSWPLRGFLAFEDRAYSFEVVRIELPRNAISVSPMYYEMFGQMKKQLAQVSVWFDAAETFATENGFSVDLFLEQRLAVNQFSLVRQVQIACDTAKLGASRLTGREAPKHDDNEKTMSELRTRLAAVISYLDDFSPADFAKAGEQSISQPRWNGKTMTGADFFVEHAVPNFFFHLGHTYAILRHSGVKIGKRDYLGKLSQSEPT